MLGRSEVVGVEVDEAAAAEARTRYTKVHCAPVEDVVGELHRPFDTILCYDVLEHLVDPAHVLSELRRLSHAGTQLHLSVPNARHLSLVRDLVLKGTFGYAELGHRDSTHLRWFTNKDLGELLTSTGWARTNTVGSKVGKSLILSNLTAGRLDEFPVLQWQILGGARMTEIVAVVPTYNSRRWIDGCLSALAGQVGVELTTVVVDNASTDGTPQQSATTGPMSDSWSCPRTGGTVRPQTPAPH